MDWRDPYTLILSPKEVWLLQSICFNAVRAGVEQYDTKTLRSRIWPRGDATMPLMTTKYVVWRRNYVVRLTGPPQ